MTKLKKFEIHKILWFYSLEKDLGWTSLSLLNADIVDTIYRDINKGELWAPPDDGTLKAMRRISTLRRRFGWQLQQPS